MKIKIVKLMNFCLLVFIQHHWLLILSVQMFLNHYLPFPQLYRKSQTDRGPPQLRYYLNTKVYFYMWLHVSFKLLQPILASRILVVFIHKPCSWKHMKRLNFFVHTIIQHYTDTHLGHCACINYRRHSIESVVIIIF